MLRRRDVSAGEALPREVRLVTVECRENLDSGNLSDYFIDETAKSKLFGLTVNAGDKPHKAICRNDVLDFDFASPVHVSR